MRPSRRGNEESRTTVTLLFAQHLAFPSGDVNAAIELLRDRIASVDLSAQAPLRGLLSFICFFAGFHDEALEAALP